MGSGAHLPSTQADDGGQGDEGLVGARVLLADVDALGVRPGDLGAAVPDGWHETVRGRGQLVVLVGSAIDLGLVDRTEWIEAARRAGGVVGAEVPVQVVDLRDRS
jgi:hypothetical protein